MGKNFTAYSVGLMSASVCTSLPLEQATELLNLEHPTGIGSQWTFAEDEPFADGSANPHECEQQPATHKHYLFHC